MIKAPSYKVIAWKNWNADITVNIDTLGMKATNISQCKGKVLDPLTGVRCRNGSRNQHQK